MADLFTHNNALVKLCRVCGKVLTGKSVYKVKDYLVKLQDCFRASFTINNPEIPPPSFCHVCFATMQNVKGRNTVHSIFPINNEQLTFDNF